MSYVDELRAHCSEHWEPPIKKLRWERGPAHELPPEFGVMVFQRSSSPALIYSTIGMSQPEDEERLEVHLIAKSGGGEIREDDILEILTAVAHFHRTRERLRLGTSVNFGKPWQPGSSCSYGFVSLPYIDGPELQWLPEPRVQFLWLIPITESELNLKLEKGVEALEEKFDEAQFEYWNPHRASVV